jgi:hypothetical protein
VLTTALAELTLDNPDTVLWLGGPVVLSLGVLIAGLLVRGRSRQAGAALLVLGIGGLCPICRLDRVCLRRRCRLGRYVAPCQETLTKRENSIPSPAWGKWRAAICPSRRPAEGPLAGRPFVQGYLIRVIGQGTPVAISPVGVSAAMRVRISNPDCLEDLRGNLEATECRVRKVGEATLDVAMDRAPSVEQARREVAIYSRPGRR